MTATARHRWLSFRAACTPAISAVASCGSWSPTETSMRGDVARRDRQLIVANIVDVAVAERGRAASAPTTHAARPQDRTGMRISRADERCRSADSDVAGRARGLVVAD